MIIEQTDYNLAEPGEYQATLDSYEDLGDVDDPFKEGETKHQVKLVWKLADGKEQWDWVNASLFPGSVKYGPSKLYEIASLLLRANPPKKLDLDLLLGRTLTVSIKRYTDQQGKDRAKIDNYSIHTDRQVSERISQLAPAPISDADLPY